MKNNSNNSEEFDSEMSLIEFFEEKNNFKEIKLIISSRLLKIISKEPNEKNIICEYANGVLTIKGIFGITRDQRILRKILKNSKGLVLEINKAETGFAYFMVKKEDI